MNESAAAAAAESTNFESTTAAPAE